MKCTTTSCRELFRAVSTCPPFVMHVQSISNEGCHHTDTCCAALQTHSSWQQSSMSQGFCQQIQVSYLTLHTMVMNCLRCSVIPIYNLGMPLPICDTTEASPQCRNACLLSPGVSEFRSPVQGSRFWLKIDILGSKRD